MIMLKKLRIDKKGFTIVEVLVASAIAVLAITAVISLYIQYQQNFLRGSAYLDMQSNARIAMDWMVRDIRWSSNVVKTYGAYTTSNTVIVTRVYSIDKTITDPNKDNILKDLTGHVCYDYIIYRIQNNNLERIVDAVSSAASKRTDETRTIAKNCTSLAFEGKLASASSWHNLSYYASTDLNELTEIKIELTTSKMAPSPLTGTIQDTIKSSVKLRNRI